MRWSRFKCKGLNGLHIILFELIHDGEGIFNKRWWENRDDVSKTL